jgi:hypothetical protein
MKKLPKTAQENASENKANALNWKGRKEIITKSIPLEVDLENRQLFFKTDIKERLNFEFPTNNLDNIIQTYIDPKDSKKVKQWLTKAKKGQEEPILFNFIHPETSRSFQMEYRYQITYVKYSSTRLQGELMVVLS